MNNSKQWVEVDAESLAAEMAESAWEVDTNQIAEEDLYEWVERPGQWSWEDLVKVKQVRSIWAHKFFNLKDRYSEMILRHKK